MTNCDTCSNLITINEHGDFVRDCAEKLETKREDFDCEKYEKIIMYCSYCD